MSTPKRQSASTAQASSKRASSKRPSSKRATTSKRASSKRAASRRTAPAADAGAFVCPECGRTFSRAAALGAHRSRAHGVAGRAKRATSRPTRSSSSRATGGSGIRSRAATRTGPGAVASREGIDRDALLKSVFPDGIPASEDVIRAVTVWLDDAERLVRMR
jgi:predicted RNA-binding Zn-ribbon protein involved in translation (DUF1610 family)